MTGVSITTPLEGCLVIAGAASSDLRGSFAKPLSSDVAFPVREIFWSRSRRSVIRGMHLQAPPHEMTKIVWCCSGRILDVLVDLRVESPTYGECFSVELDPGSAQAVVIPPGIAHGFLALEDSLTCYATDRQFAPSADTGVHWSSIGFEWPVELPIVSERDAALPHFSGVVREL